MDLSDPSMYQMACWMSVVNKQSKIDGITFDEFISQAIFFFSQRHHDEGLRYIFELFDVDQKGSITVEELQAICQELGFSNDPRFIMHLFKQAAGSKKTIDFEDFALIMRRENYY